jgi:surface antigen
MAKQKAIREALDALNCSYGRGSIVKVVFAEQGPTSATGFVVCRKQYGVEAPRFRVEGGTVYFRGHQQKV